MTKVIAARMETPPLIDWVEYELGGYPEDAVIPDYRGPFPTHVLSVWSGPMSSVLTNVPIPSSAVPQGLRDAGAFEVDFRQSVSELARLAQQEEMLPYGWGPDVVGLLNGDMMRGELPNLQGIAPLHGIVSASRQVSPAVIGSVLDNVRTRVLDLALEFEKVAPDAGEPGAKPADQTTINHITTIIYGHDNTVAVQGSAVGQHVTVQAGDLDSLTKALSQLGLRTEDVAELKHAIQDDEADEDTPKGQQGGASRSS